MEPSDVAPKCIEFKMLASYMHLCSHISRIKFLFQNQNARHLIEQHRQSKDFLPLQTTATFCVDIRKRITMEESDRNTLNFTDRLQTFHRSSLLSNDIELSFNELSAIGYYYDDISSRIRCHRCAFTIQPEDVNRLSLITQHGQASPECEVLMRSVVLGL